MSDDTANGFNSIERPPAYRSAPKLSYQPSRASGHASIYDMTISDRDTPKVSDDEKEDDFERINKNVLQIQQED